jgi:hypothetical protein
VDGTLAATVACGLVMAVLEVTPDQSQRHVPTLARRARIEHVESSAVYKCFIYSS